MNRQIEIIDNLNQIIDAIKDNKDDYALNVATTLRNEIKEEVEKQESDIDIQLQLENESKYGK
jgi:hypothetical protein